MNTIILDKEYKEALTKFNRVFVFCFVALPLIISLAWFFLMLIWTGIMNAELIKFIQACGVVGVMIFVYYMFIKGMK